MAAEDYTHFRFPTLPTKCLLQVDGINAERNFWYDKLSELKTLKTNIKDFGEPFDFFTYQTTNGLLISEPAEVLVNFTIDETLSPSTTNQEVIVLDNNEIIFSDFLEINDGTDRIKIIDFDKNLNISYYGGLLYPNIEIAKNDLKQLIYKVSAGYKKLYFQVGNKEGFNPDIYYVEFKNEQLAFLNQVYFVQKEDIDTFSIEALIEIINGVPDEDAELTINFNLTQAPFNDPLNTNEINVFYNTLSIEKNNINSETITAKVETLGTLNILIELKVFKVDFPVVGNIDVILNSVNNDPLKVSSNNLISLPINFTI
jgi:hypothetical protein